MAEQPYAVLTVKTDAAMNFAAGAPSAPQERYYLTREGRTVYLYTPDGVSSLVFVDKNVALDFAALLNKAQTT